MTIMTGFALVAHLMQTHLGGRFRHLPPTVAAELEAFAADQETAAAAKPESRAGDGRVPSPLQDRCPPPRRQAA